MNEQNPSETPKSPTVPPAQESSSCPYDGFDTSESTDVPPIIDPYRARRADTSTTVPSALKQSRPVLGDDPAERAPIGNVFALIEAVLRQPRQLFFQLRQPGAGRLILMMLGVALVCAAVYGVVAGTFSGGTQLWAAPMKIAGGLLVSAAICLPSLYIFSCLSGSRASLVEVCGLLAGLLMLMTILLVGFAPVAWIFSSSTESLPGMGTLHLIFGFIAVLFGINFMKSGFALSSVKSSAGVNVWVIVFLLVVLQMMTSLRPIIGTADTLLPTEKRFFLVHWADCFSKQNSVVSSQ